MKNIRQNFLLSAKTKQLLDKNVPKGQQSKFVDMVVRERINSKNSWRKILEMPVLLDVDDPVKYAKKIRKEWDRKL